MARAGRKRKFRVKREPNGQASRRQSPESIEESRTKVAMCHPERNLAAKLGRDPLDDRLSAYLTRLEFWGQISKRQCGAGISWSGMVRRYRIALGLPDTLPRAAMGRLMKGGGGNSTHDDPDLDELRSQYDRAHEALSKAGRAALKATRDACLFGLEADVVELRRGLDALIAGQGLRRAA